MAEQRLIDANALNVDLTYDFTGHPMNGHRKTTFANIRAEILRQPTIDHEALPIVRQLREELALITQQRDTYKSVFERITAHGDCNDCEDVKGCRFAPGIGEDTRYNCPLWRGPQKEGA